MSAETHCLISFLRSKWSFSLQNSVAICHVLVSRVTNTHYIKNLMDLYWGHVELIVSVDRYLQLF